MKKDGVFNSEAFNGEAVPESISLAVIDNETVPFNLCFVEKPKIAPNHILYEYIGEGTIHTMEGELKPGGHVRHFYRRVTPSSEE